MKRDRACAAILNNGQILMVCHQTATRTYWTFPGGGVNPGETLEQAVLREVKEETGLDVKVNRLLFEEDYEYGKSYCYLAEMADTGENPSLDFLPEEESIFGTMLHSVAWHSIYAKRDDLQVSKVISILGLDYD